MARRFIIDKKIENDEYFEPTQYQPESDDHFVGIVSDYIKSNHNIITIDNEYIPISIIRDIYK